MPDVPLAYHITFGTYGTRLHGDPRGTVSRGRNKPGDPIIGIDQDWMREERSILRFEPVFLSDAQRRAAELVVPSICDRGGWQLHAAAARPDHVHVLLTADADGDAVRKWFKRWLGQELSASWPLPNEARWWSIGGSVKWVWHSRYFDNVNNYILRQRTTY